MQRFLEEIFPQEKERKKKNYNSANRMYPTPLFIKITGKVKTGGE